MNVDYRARAVRDHHAIAIRSRTQFGEAIAAGFEQRLREAIEHIAANPEAVPVVEQRPEIRVVKVRWSEQQPQSSSESIGGANGLAQLLIRLRIPRSHY